MRWIILALLLPGCSMLPEVSLPDVPEIRMPDLPKLRREPSEPGCGDPDKAWQESLACAQFNAQQFCDRYNRATLAARTTMAGWMDRTPNVRCERTT